MIGAVERRRARGRDEAPDEINHDPHFGGLEEE